MILPDPDDKTTPSPTRYAHVPPGYYPNGADPYASSSSHGPSSSSGRSDSLRPPPSWPQSASESALPLPSPSFSPLSRSASSQPYIPPVTPVQPPSFSRPPPPNLPRTPFPPMFLLAEQNSLRRGFPVVLPPTTITPHPFATYDVLQDDWAQFLGDMRTIASLSPEDHANAYCIPILSAVPIINIAIAGAITHHIRRKKPRLVSLLVDKWNHLFFHPRKMEVILMRGQTKLSGQSDQPVAHLYTPRTVNFTAPPVDLSPSSSPPPSIGRAKSNYSTPSPVDRATSPTEAELGASKAETRAAKRARDKTYRLFVVSMEA
ncbi:hypothetical protein FB451DRAFT_1292995 [Mycena latifolia]|nr:hypothetical protein FB451DRAFT_1292995 [Mycena latifolia]